MYLISLGVCRRETKNMFCMLCSEIQPAAQICRNCEETVARYYCDTCKLWDDDPTKSIYHCDQCGICRQGKGLGEDFFHCEKCNICMVIGLKDNHRCIERNLECDCPICGEYMFTSTSKVIFEVCRIVWSVRKVKKGLAHGGWHCCFTYHVTPIILFSTV
jgi:hypothetical protein